MNSILTRLSLVIGLVVVVQLLVLRHEAQPEVMLPAVPIEQFPRQFGNWQGEEEQLDPKLFAATGADSAVERRYHDKAGNVVTFFLALYKDPSTGLYHSPANCYRSNGWTQMETQLIPLTSHDREPTNVSLTTWDQKEKDLVLYWYEIGNDTLFERFDLLKVQWARRGKSKWPPMYKVLLQAKATDPVVAQANLVEVAGEVRDWLRKVTPDIDSK